ncbi:hypothetical protein XaclCFBP3371_14210 [Xanthomonas euvesicatoria pv. citrumelonis]|nr:hypothetical protein XaclCFBP3371_14210 [Xanthomonas euvesicatoria pv. citrumelonis]
MHAQRPWGNGASAYRTPCSPCPVRHLQCDTRMTDYAAPKLTEMFVADRSGLTSGPASPDSGDASVRTNQCEDAEAQVASDALRPRVIVVVLAAALLHAASRGGDTVVCAGRLQSAASSTMQDARTEPALSLHRSLRVVHACNAESTGATPDAQSLTPACAVERTVDTIRSSRH